MILTELNELYLAQAALAYASMGWPVLPLRPRDKRPNGKLVRTGLKEASTDIGQIRTWWEISPASNIGLRTGDVFDVVDLDGKESLQSLKEIVTGYKHDGPVASTGKGYHLLFEPTGARNAANPLTGIDFRGQAGYIVAPPSVHPNGHKYQWIKGTDTFPPAPEWLEQIVTPKREHITGEGIDPANMEDIVNFWLKSFSDIAPLQMIGSRYITNCIWHKDDTPSLVLYPDSNSFFCFGCHEWGDTLNLIDSFMDAGTAPSEIRKRYHNA